MKKLPILLSICLILVNHVTAQVVQTESAATDYYQISSEEAEAILLHHATFDPSVLHTFICRDTFDPSHYPPGYYVSVRVVKEDIVFELFTFAPFELNTIPAGHDFEFVLTDRNGQPLSNVQPRMNGKSLTFNRRTQYYHKRKFRKSQVLEINYGGNKWFFNVEPEKIDRSTERTMYNLSNRRFGKVLTAPWFIFRNLQLKHKYGHGRKVFPLWYRPQKPFSGYTAFSQPKYRPGDTLQLKAWLSSYKGKPYNKPVWLKISDKRDYSLVRKVEVLPSSPGNYQYRMVISDSLLIDRGYNFVFEEKKGRRKGLLLHRQKPRQMWGEAYLEDYVLDEITYSFTPNQESYIAGDSIVLRAGAQDGNGQPAFDIQYKLTLTTNTIQAFYAPEVLLPDTIWQTSGQLDDTGMANIRVSNALIPPAKFLATARIIFVNTAGELQEKQVSINIDNRVPPVIVTFENGRVFFRAGNPDRQGDTVKITEFREPNPDFSFKTALPYSTALQPNVRKYEVKSGDFHTDFTPNLQDAVEVAGLSLDDTVVFRVKNPFGLLIHYTVLKNNKKEAEGAFSDSLMVWKKNDPQTAFWQVFARYVANGETSAQDAWLINNAKELKVDISQPDRVIPGAPVQVKIKVLDNNNKPVQQADVTAAAYNALFGSQPNTQPQLRMKRQKPVRENRKYRTSLLRYRVFRDTLEQVWYSQFSLDTLPFYRIRHLSPPTENAFCLATPVMPFAYQDKRGKPLPKYPMNGQLPGISKSADIMYQDRPQFNIFAVRDFRSLPIHLIWVNERLVYYAGYNDLQPYSFFGEKGYNKVRVRLIDGEYTLDSIWMDAGHKYTISFYAQGWGTRPEKVKATSETLQHTAIRWEPRPDSLTYWEENLLRKSTLQLRQRSVGKGWFNYCWDRYDNIHLLARYQEHTFIGPFGPGNNINMLYPGDYMTQFPFDPGFEYEVFPDRERLFESKWPAKNRKLPKNLSLRDLNDWAYGPHHIQVQPDNWPPIIFRSVKADAQGMGSLQIRFQQRDTALKCMVLLGDTLVEGPYAPYTNTWKGLPPGQYLLRLYSISGWMAETAFAIKADTVLYRDLNTLSFRLPLPEERLDSMYPYQKSASYSILPVPSKWQNMNCDAYLTGTVVDSNEPLIGASVKVLREGVFVRGAITDVEGQYRLCLPVGEYEVEVSYTGYTTQRMDGVQLTSSGMTVLNQTMESSTSLQEVVVTAYKIPLIAQDNTSAGGVSIRGSRSNATNYYVDGIRVLGAVVPSTDLEEAIVSSRPFYGALPPGREPMGLPPGVQYRSRFTDHAYFQPSLRTDERGEAWFQTTFPDNITGWESYAIAAGKKGRYGLGRHFTQSYKPLTAQLAVPRFLLAGDVVEVSGQVSNYTPDSLQLGVQFEQGGRLLREEIVSINKSWSGQALLTAPRDSQQIQVSFAAGNPDFSDGEKRVIPIFPVGDKTTKGHFLLLDKDTSLSLSFAPNRGPIHCYARATATDILLAQIEDLRTYPYGCNEQTASRLVALLSLKTIKNAQKQPFLYEKDIYACLKRLQTAQLPDGSWGWWAGNERNNWMTIYVADALLLAKKSGYTVRFLDQALPPLRAQLGTMTVNDRVAALTLLRKAGVNLDCSQYIPSLDSLYSKNLGKQLSVLQLRFLCGALVIRDSLTQLLDTTTFGGIYCGNAGTDWYNRRATNTFQAYQIAEAAGWTDISEGIRRYWLEMAGEYRNTCEKARIVAALVPALQLDRPGNATAQLRINGMEVDSFPAQMTFAPGGDLTIEKSGSGIVWFNAWQEWHETEPSPETAIFEVKTSLQNALGNIVTDLKQGEAATILVNVKVKRAAEYTMLRVPIPAACTYGEKTNWTNPESHREYFKDNTAIFFQYLPAGEYQFKIALESRFSGTFTINPARMEQMYFPVFYGRNGVKKVRVEP